MIIYVLLVEGNKGLCDGLSDGIDLRSMASSTDIDMGIHTSEMMTTEEKDKFDKLNGAFVGGFKCLTRT